MSDATTLNLDIERAEALGRRLAATVSTRRIYAPDHARAQTAFQELVADLRQAFAITERVKFTVTGGILTHEGVPVSGAAGSVNLAQLLGERECGGVALSAGIADETLSALVDWLAGRRAAGLRPRGEGFELLDPGAGEELTEKREKSVLADRLPELKLPLEVHTKAVQLMEQLLSTARSGHHLDMGAVTSVVKLATEAARSGGVQLLAATQLPQESPESCGHPVNVFLIATAMMEPLATDAKELEIFAQAALLHDVGKAAVPEEIAAKKGPLTPEEELILRRHCEFGAKMLARMPHVDPLAIEVAYCHHMRDDGEGYPTPILPIKPGPVTSMVQVGDMFDLIAEARPQGRGLSTDEAVDRILRTPGMKSRRDVLRHFVRRATSSPPGSEVRLEGGERAIVVEVFPDAPHHPRVRVVKDRDGRTVEQPHVLDLREAGLDARPVSQIFLKPK